MSEKQIIDELNAIIERWNHIARDTSATYGEIRNGLIDMRAEIESVLDKT